MIKISIAIIGFCACINSFNTQAQANSLKLTASITLPNVKGRIDHLSFYSKHQLVFVAALGNNTIEVVDLKAKKVIHTISDLSEPQGIVYIPQNNSIFVANGGTGICDIFSADSYQKKATIKLSGDADNVRYDSTGKKIYVGYGDGGIAIIDATTFKPISEIKFSGHPESFQIDQAAKKIYVNVPDEKQIEVIDLEINKLIEKWKITEASSNFPMSLDGKNHRLFIGCRHPAKLLIMDTKTGKTVSSFEVDSDTDDVFYNKVNNEIYLSCGAGYVDVFKQVDANKYIPEGKVSTHSGARTSFLIPELNQLIVASPSGINKDATLLAYSVSQN